MALCRFVCWPRTSGLEATATLRSLIGLVMRTPGRFAVARTRRTLGPVACVETRRWSGRRPASVWRQDPASACRTSCEPRRLQRRSGSLRAAALRLPTGCCRPRRQTALRCGVPQPDLELLICAVGSCQVPPVVVVGGGCARGRPCLSWSTTLVGCGAGDMMVMGCRSRLGKCGAAARSLRAVHAGVAAAVCRELAAVHRLTWGAGAR